MPANISSIILSAKAAWHGKARLAVAWRWFIFLFVTEWLSLQLVEYLWRAIKTWMLFPSFPHHGVPDTTLVFFVCYMPLQLGLQLIFLWLEIAIIWKCRENTSKAIYTHLSVVALALCLALALYGAGRVIGLLITFKGY